MFAPVGNYVDQFDIIEILKIWPQSLCLSPISIVSKDLITIVASKLLVKSSPNLKYERSGYSYNVLILMQDMSLG